MAGAVRVTQWYDRFSTLTSAERLVTSEVMGSIPSQTHSSCDRERTTLSNSVGFFWGLRFPPTLHHKSPNIVYRANTVPARNSIFLVHGEKQGALKKKIPLSPKSECKKFGNFTTLLKPHKIGTHLKGSTIVFEILPLLGEFHHFL
jgi:hypothetical protein